MHVAIWPFGKPCGHLVFLGSCAHPALRKDMWLPGPLKGQRSMWSFEEPCGHLALWRTMWPFEKPCGHLALFKGHMAIQVFGGGYVAIWPLGGPCGRLVSQGSCAHLALRKFMLLPRPLKGHVFTLCFEGPCAHLAL